MVVATPPGGGSVGPDVGPVGPPVASVGPIENITVTVPLKGLTHEMDLAFDGTYGRFKPK
jgi:hypothetical protein